jgi:alpha-tubulin suppressor-like RCC1 family protein
VAVNTGLTFEQIATGGNHACALTSAAGGDIWCWGANYDGQLGDGTLTDSPDPVMVDDVGGTLSFISITAGYDHNCAETTAGDTYCWGDGYQGQVGEGGFGEYTTPTLVAGSHTFSYVDVGRYTSCASDGSTGYCWGDNFWGEVGDGASALNDLPTPTGVAGGISFPIIAGGGNHSCGIASSGSVYCWGTNRSGELGIGYKQTWTGPVAVLGNIVAKTPAFSPTAVDAPSSRLPLSTFRR